jgi:hypothetical protein
MTTVDEAGPAVSERSMSQVVTETVRAFRAQVPDCTVAALVDMSTGMLLAVDTLEDYPGDELDLLAAATFDLFQGRNVGIIADVLNGGKADRHYFQEMVVQSDTLLHIFLRSAKSEDLVAVVVCRRAANMGMLFAQARVVMRQMDADFSG